MTIFFKTSEHTVRGMAGYAGKPISMVGIFLHDCKEPDVVGLFDGNIFYKNQRALAASLMKLARQRQDAASGAQNPGTAAKEENDIQDFLFQHRNSSSISFAV